MQDRFGGLNVRDAASRPSDPSGRPAAASAASELGGESWEPSRTVYNENTRPTGRTDNPAAAAPLLASTQGFGSHIGPEVDDSVQDQHLTAEGSLGTASVLTRRQSASGANRVDDGRRSDIMWRRTLRIGSNLDVKDTVDKWCEASVIDLDGEAGMVRVTYTFWTPKWDEWIRIDSPRLAPPSSRTYQEGGPLRIGHRVEALDETKTWLEAEVIEESPEGRALLHFRSYHKKFDFWAWPHEGKVRQFGPYRSVPKGSRSSSRKVSLAPGQQHVRQIEQLSNRYEHYRRALESRRLRVVPVEGDGNCLFRSVSHQVYGDQNYHALVRARCMDYMESEAHFFEPYVEGDMVAFLRYVTTKRQNAVWGDDPEVQALCEIYDRPAEIWAYDPQLGAKTLRTFHEAAGRARGQLEARRPPMRLSYYGGGHYDSVSPIDDRAPVGEESQASATIPEPGVLEESALERSRRRKAEAGSGRWDPEEMKLRQEDESPSEQSIMDHALAWSRNVFEAQFDDIESALVASVDHMEESHLSSLKAASRDSELVVLQEEMLLTAQAQSEEEQLRKALEASRCSAAAAAAEAEMVSQAIAESMALTSGGLTEKAGTVEGKPSSGADGQDNQVHGAAAAGNMVAGEDEDEDLKKALLLSGMVEEWEAPPEGVGTGQDFDLDELQEDPELRFAINASLAGD